MLRELLYENTLFVAIIMSAIIGRIMQDSKTNILKMWTVFLTGTFLHELAHFTVGMILLAFPYKFSILPKRVEKGSNSFTMGHVKFLYFGWFNILWTSMAPLLLLPLSYVVYKYFFTLFEYSILNFFIWIFLILSMVFSSIPSSVDFNSLKQGSLILNLFGGLFVFIIAYFLYYIGAIEWLYLVILKTI